MQSPSVKDWIYNSNVAESKNELTKFNNGRNRYENINQLIPF
jgi:hypothetical protein